MIKYDLDYYERMLKKYSKTAEDISRIRWDWIMRKGIKSVLDYGSGVGWFRAYRPEGVDVDSFDIGPYPQTGLKLKLYDILCLWDVLEHIPDFRSIEPLFRLSNNIAGTVPMIPADKQWNKWKHFKPSEHYHYFTLDGLCNLFEKYGFVLEDTGYPECPPREDVISFFFKRR